MVCTASSGVYTAGSDVCTASSGVCVRFSTSVHVPMSQLYCMMAVVLTID